MKLYQGRCIIVKNQIDPNIQREPEVIINEKNSFNADNVLVLGFSAICSASNGKVLDAEEAMVNKFLAASNYSAVTSMMTDGMKKDFTEEVFKNFKEQMDKNFGAVSEKRLVVIEKGADADILRYSMKFAKQPEAMMSFLFAVKNEKPLLGDFGIALPQKEENKEAAK